MTPSPPAAVIDAVRGIYTEWSNQRQSFRNENHMEEALKAALERSLPRVSVFRQKGLGLGRRLSAWTYARFDIQLFNGEECETLLELDYGSTDPSVDHALHNGELKLLGNTSGLGLNNEKSYATERGLGSYDLAILRARLSRISCRGLFFVEPRPAHAHELDRDVPAIWHETKDAPETHFWSDLMAPARVTKLRHVFQQLSQMGICCWFYSLVDGDRLECLPSNN